MPCTAERSHEGSHCYWGERFLGTLFLGVYTRVTWLVKPDTSFF
jgi:hypothetical protein